MKESRSRSAGLYFPLGSCAAMPTWNVAMSELCRACVTRETYDCNTVYVGHCVSVRTVGIA